MAEARAVKFCTQGDYIKSCQGWWWFGSREPFLHALTDIYNVVDDGPLFLPPYDTADTLRVKLHRFDFLCICCKLACVIRRQQIDQVEFGPSAYEFANNRQVRVCVAKISVVKISLAALLPVNFTWRKCGIGDFA